MSIESVTAFMVDLIDNPELENEVNALADGGNPENGISAGALVEFASSKGYDFIAEEFEAYGGELDDAALEAVAGGMSFSKVGQKVQKVVPVEQVTLNYEKISRFVKLGRLEGL
jgi:hypothetical protein